MKLLSRYCWLFAFVGLVGCDADLLLPPVDDQGPICTGGERRCNGNALEQCADDGLAWNLNETCTASCDSEALVCTTQTCTPGIVRCNQAGTAAVVCDESGTTETVQTNCPGGCNAATNACFAVLVASAGDDVSVATGESVTLSGTATGAVGDIRCDWALLTAPNEPFIVNDCAPVITATATASYILTVTDTGRTAFNTATDGVTITVIPAECANGELDEGETAIDCGGACPGCPTGTPGCTTGNDCATYVCDTSAEPSVCAELTAVAVANPTALHLGGSSTLTGTSPGLEPALLEVAGACSWLASTGETLTGCTQTVSPIADTTYTLTIRNTLNGETATATAQVSVVAALRADAGPDVQTAFGSLVNLNGQAYDAIGAFTCAWTRTVDGAADAAFAESTCAIQVQPANNVRYVYTLRVVDSSGAQATDDVVVRAVPLVANAGGLQQIQPGESYTLRAAWEGATACADAPDCACDTASGYCVACVWTWRSDDGRSVITDNSCDLALTGDRTPVASKDYGLVVTDTHTGAFDDDRASLLVSGAPSILCSWDLVTFSIDGLSNGNGNYQPTEEACDPTSNGAYVITQYNNSNPSMALTGLLLENVKVTANITVRTVNDDDFIGLVWGWEDAQHFYLLNWKQGNQSAPAATCGYGGAGMAVLKFDGAATPGLNLIGGKQHSYTTATQAHCADFWMTTRRTGTSTAQESLLDQGVTLLQAADDQSGFTTGWTDNKTYRFELYYTGTRSRVLIYDGATLIHSVQFDDTSFPRGRFGAFTHSQDSVEFSNVSFTSLGNGPDVAVSVAPSSVVPRGASATLTATNPNGLGAGPFTCEWSTGGAVVEASACSFTPELPNASGVVRYSVTLTDSLGKSATTTQDVTVQ